LSLCIREEQKDGWRQAAVHCAPPSVSQPRSRCPLIISVFQSSDGSTELLRRNAFERLDATAPASPVQYWGLGGIGRPATGSLHPTAAWCISATTAAAAHHAKLIHLKHNAALEREAAGLAPRLPPSSQGDQVERLAGGRKADLLRRHMKAALFDREAGQEYQQRAAQDAADAQSDSERVTEQCAERPVRAGRLSDDLSESSSPDSAMGTHFLSSPLKPALQGRDSGKAYEHQGQHDVQEDMSRISSRHRATRHSRASSHGPRWREPNVCVMREIWELIFCHRPTGPRSSRV